MASFNFVYFDPALDGHHVSSHARTIIGEAVRRGWRCLWLTSPAAMEHPASRQLIAEMGDALKLEVAAFPQLGKVSGKFGQATIYEIRHYWALCRSLRRLARVHRVDTVYLAWLDHCPRMFGLFGLPDVGLNYSGMHMHVSLHENNGAAGSRFARLTRSLTRRMYTRPNLRGVAVIIEQFAEYAKAMNLPGLEKITYVPDIAFIPPQAGRHTARSTLNLRDEDVLVLSYGALTGRKGIPALMQACQQVAEPQRLVILLAGRQEPGVTAHIFRERDELLKKGVRLIEWNRFLDDSAEALSFAAADIVWMGYCGFTGSSGVLLQAAAAGLPVIACQEGAIGRTAQKHELGPRIDPADPLAVVSALNRLVADSEFRRRCGEHGRRMAEQHLPVKFGSAICNLIFESARGRST
ncbi:MAG: glycosyltransferase family 4 protein [Verrucomicrobiota bacterium]